MVKKDRLVKTLIDLIKIDSPSGEERAVGQEIAKRVKKIGGKPEFDSYGNLIIKFPGKGEPLMLNAHMDTVEPGRGIKPKVTGNKITSDGTTVLGADPKAGIAAIIEAITSAREYRKKHLPLEVVLTREEETGLGGSANLDYSKISAKRCVIFDGDEEVYKMFVSGPWYYSLDAVITGRSAHAGVEPEKGVSAIVIASKIISSLRLGRIDHETTANIGMVSGGSARNAVPEKATITGEVRSRNTKTLARHVKHVQKVFDKVGKQFPEAKIELNLVQKLQGFKMTPEHEIVKFASYALKAVGLAPQYIDTCGGTDANIFHQHGIESTIVGTGVWSLHTTREYAVIPEIVQAAKFCEKLITGS